MPPFCARFSPSVVRAVPTNPSTGWLQLSEAQISALSCPEPIVVMQRCLLTALATRRRRRSMVTVPLLPPPVDATHGTSFYWMCL